MDDTLCRLIDTLDPKIHVFCNTLGYSTPAPTSAPISTDDDDSSSESRWLDATWEIVVTVVAALVVAGGSMLFKLWLSRRGSSSNY